jgi:ribosome-binding protein aMBF1 (putative translation factor)
MVDKLKKELFKNKAFKKYYYNNDLSFLISEMVFEARVKKELTQLQLAKKIKTKQSSIARLESGKFVPSISFLKKIADALGAELVPPKIVFKSNKK